MIKRLSHNHSPHSLKLAYQAAYRWSSFRPQCTSQSVSQSLRSDGGLCSLQDEPSRRRLLMKWGQMSDDRHIEEIGVCAIRHGCLHVRVCVCVSWIVRAYHSMYFWNWNVRRHKGLRSAELWSVLVYYFSFSAAWLLLSDSQQYETWAVNHTALKLPAG